MHSIVLGSPSSLLRPSDIFEVQMLKICQCIRVALWRTGVIAVKNQTRDFVEYHRSKRSIFQVIKMGISTGIGWRLAGLLPQITPQPAAHSDRVYISSSPHTVLLINVPTRCCPMFHHCMLLNTALILRKLSLLLRSYSQLIAALPRERELPA